jgi:hypothetical protein
MSSSTHKKKANKDASETFFLYVFFHAIWTGIFKIFED